MYRSLVATGLEDQHARSLGIVGIILNHLRLAQTSGDFTGQYTVFGKFVIAVFGYTIFTNTDKLLDLPKCRTHADIVS
jgi:hypothetical protein